jgi:hypothetical protein
MATKTTPKTKAPKPVAPPPPVEDPLFLELWERFRNEAGFVPEAMELEKQKVRDEIAALEARIAEKRANLDAIDHKETAARDQLKALISARLSPDAILSAMRIEYRVRKAAAPKPPKADASGSIASDDKELVFSNLDAEGLSIADLKKLTGKDGSFLQSVLKALLAEGRIVKSGERGAARYHLA